MQSNAAGDADQRHDDGAPGAQVRHRGCAGLISLKVFFKSFCRSQLSHKFVNLSFTISNIKNKLTELCGNRLFKNDFINTFCEIKLRAPLCKTRASLLQNLALPQVG